MRSSCYASAGHYEPGRSEVQAERSRGGGKVLGLSMIIRRQTATMWALWLLILIRAMSMEGGYSFFNYMRMEPLRIGPRIQKSDTNFKRVLEQGLELARTP